MVSSDVEVVADLLPAVTEFAEATGMTEPVRELATWAADLIRSRRLPHQAKLMMRAAEKIRASGMPVHAVSDKMLRAILENGPLEDDESMQERWANLLANALTGEAGGIPPSFPTILAELEPAEAQKIDDLVTRCGTAPFTLGPTFGAEARQWDNMFRLRLIEKLPPESLFGGLGAAPLPPAQKVVVTRLGCEFVAACRDPAGDP
jgi:hypothetical protein